MKMSLESINKFNLLIGEQRAHLPSPPSMVFFKSLRDDYVNIKVGEDDWLILLKKNSSNCQVI